MRHQKAAAALVECEDPLNVEGNMIPYQATVTKETTDFDNNFRYYDGTSNKVHWADPRSEEVSMADLMGLRAHLPLSPCPSHCITALKMWLGAEAIPSPGAGMRLVVLYQPMLMLSKQGLPRPDGSGKYLRGEFELQPSPDGNAYYRLDIATHRLISLTSADADTLQNRYARIMRSIKVDGGTSYDSMKQYESDLKADGDTKCAIFPFQEILGAYGAYDPQHPRTVTILHATALYNSDNNPFPASRWKHHLIISIMDDEGKREFVGTSVTSRAYKNANLSELIPPNKIYATYQLAGQ